MNLIGGGRIKAAGAVVWRPGADGPQLALIHRPRYDDWSFAKGKDEPGEHAVLTALREVEEETGLRVVLGRRLPNTDYEVLGQPKRVKYWAARSSAQPPFTALFTPNDEVDELEWVTAAEARERLTSPLDVEVLDAFLAAPADTFPIILQRHGKAERRDSKYQDDLLRPLAPAGRLQAEALAELLAAFGDIGVISSPAARCVATIRPYTERTGVSLQTDPALTEISYVHAPRAVVGWLRELIDKRQPTIVCTHGPLLDELIAAVLYSPGFGEDGDGDGARPTLNGRPWSAAGAQHWADESLSTGCAWVLHFDADADDAVDDGAPRLVAVDRLRS